MKQRVRGRGGVPLCATAAELEGYARALFETFEANRNFIVAMLTASWAAPSLRGSRRENLSAMRALLDAAYPEAPEDERAAATSSLRALLAGAAHFAWTSQYARWAVRAGAEASPFAGAVRHGDALHRAGFVALAVVVVPLAEELFFRAWLPNALAKDLPPRWARYSAVPAAALFAMVHGSATWIPAFAGGLLASWLLARSGRLASNLAWHATNNGLVIAFALLG